MRIVINMATVNEAATADPAQGPAANRTTTTSRGLAVPTQASARSPQTTASSDAHPVQTSTQTQDSSRIWSSNPDGYYLNDLMDIDENFKKASASAPMATKLSDKMAVMLKKQVQICKGLQKEVNELRAKYEAKDHELKQVKEDSEKQSWELKARAEESRAWEKECESRLQEWDAAQTAYKRQLTDNGAWGWEV